MAHPARLTSDLLARNGTAFPTVGLAAANRALAEPPATRAAPLKPYAPEPAILPPGPARSQPARGKGRIKMTIRLDPDQHTRLRILAALRRCTSQEVMIRALDAYIRACGSDCTCLRRAGPPDHQN